MPKITLCVLSALLVLVFLIILLSSACRPLAPEIFFKPGFTTTKTEDRNSAADTVLGNGTVTTNQKTFQIVLFFCSPIMAFISRLGCFMLFAAFIVIGMNFAVIHTLRNSNSDNKFDELQKAKDEVTFWKDKASRTEEKYANNPNKHPVCQQLSYPTPSALSLWHLNINAILKATQLPKDSKFEFHDFTAELLQIISPRLPRSVKSIPHEWSSLERAMTVAWERYQYNSLSKTQLANIADSPPPRPLKILVMGGSLLVGQNCRQVKKELGIYMLLPLRECNWSNRLDEFLNAYFGAGMVEVTKVAMGGTNTATGNVIWDFDLIPENSKNPDVVVNAYSTNDMHVLTNMQAQSANTTLRDKVFEMTQEYVRSILKTCNPNQPPPLLLHVDDYLGNEQRKIWDTTELSQGVQVLANYYGFTSFSYADTVRDIVYGDTYESWFSSNWWENNIYQRQIHPGMGMHISSMWVVVYNLLNLVTTYCSMPTMPSSYSSTSTTYTEGFLGLPKLRKDVAQAKGKPKPPPRGLPPVLTEDLLIEDVTTLWREAEKNTISCDSKGEETQPYAIKCPFSWVSGLSLQQNDETWIEHLFRDRASTWTGWELAKDGGKLGFVPITTTNNSSSSEMVLDFSYPQTIQSVTFFFMKSYGTKWANSELLIRSSKSTGDEFQVVDERRIYGFHGKNTSEMYTESIELLEPIPVGTGLRVGAKLVGGTTFKLLGLALCS